jgi:hypothetical protein
LSNLSIEDSSIGIYLERTQQNIREGEVKKYLKKEVEMLEVTINVKQLIAMVWTLIAIVLSLIVVLTINPYYYGMTPTPWQLLVGLFFAFLLVITLPIYLLMALWQALAKSETS